MKLKLFTAALFAFTLSMASCSGDRERSKYDYRSEPSEPPIQYEYSNDWTYDQDTHWHECITWGHENLKKDETPHSFTPMYVEPTYETEGSTTYTCTVCGYSYSENSHGRIEHNYSPSWSYNEAKHWHQCIDPGYESLRGNENNHSFIKDITQPTGLTEGFTTYTCSVCGYSYTADYTSPLTYTITWKNYDGGVLEIDRNVKYGVTPSYDGATPTKPSDSYYSYEFDGWSPEISSVISDAVYTATYTASKLKTVITVAEEHMYVEVGKSKTISYSVSDQTYFNSISFKSADESIAVVSGKTVYAIASGTTTIFGYSPDGGKVIFQITSCIAIDSIKLVYSNSTIPMSFNYNDHRLLGSSVFLYSPSSATWSAYRCHFFSKDTSVFTVDELSGVVTTYSKIATAACDVTFECLFNPSYSINGTFYIKVESGTVIPSFTIYPTSPTIKVGTSRFISYSYPTTGFDFSGRMSLTSSDESVVSFATGSSVAVGPGKCIVTCTNDRVPNYSATTEVTVVGNYATSFTLSTTSINLKTSNTTKITPTFVPSSATGGKKMSYFSDNDSVATVDKDGNVFALLPGTCNITATLENNFKQVIPVTVIEGIEPTSVTLSSTALTLAPGGQSTLSTTISPSDANVYKKTTWASSNPTVATVSSTGVVKALTPGNSVVTVTLENGVSASCNVTVSDYTYPTSITLSSTSLTLKPAKTSTLTATIAPSNANIYKTVSWKSSNERVAIVTKGVVTAVAPGNCIITASLENGVKATCDVTVSDYTYPTAITLTPSQSSINPGATTAVAITYTPSDANKGLEARWTSDNTAVATVENGVVTAKAPGACNITATLNSGVSASCSITVKEYVYASTITLNYSTYTLAAEKSFTLTPTIGPTGANIGKEVTYRASNDAVTVDNKGVVTAVHQGVCDVTASLPNGASATCTVTVNDYVYASTITLDKTSMTLKKGEAGQLTCTYSPSNAVKGKNITWASSDSSIASVDSSGLVSGNRVGTCDITAILENGYSVSCSVTVNGETPVIIDVNSLSDYSVAQFVNMNVNTVRQLKTTTRVSYQSSNSNVAYVDSNNQLHANAVGSATITATDEDGLQSSFEVRVYDCTVSFTEQNTITNVDNSGVEYPLEVNIGKAKFVNGKTLAIDFTAERLTSGADLSDITFEVYDNNNNLLCVKVCKLNEFCIRNDQLKVHYDIDLSDYNVDSYSQQYVLKVVDEKR